MVELPLAALGVEVVVIEAKGIVEELERLSSMDKLVDLLW